MLKTFLARCFASVASLLFAPSISVELHREPPYRSEIESAMSRAARPFRVALLICVASAAGLYFGEGHLQLVAGAACALASLLTAVLARHSLRVHWQAASISAEECSVLAAWWDHYPDIDWYARRVVSQGRDFMQAEFDAFVAHVNAISQSAVYTRQDAVPQMIDHHDLDEIEARFGRLLHRCHGAKNALDIIRVRRGSNLEDPHELKAFINELWAWISKALDLGDYAPEVKHELEALEVEFANRSVALRHAEDGAAAFYAARARANLTVAARERTRSPDTKRGVGPAGGFAGGV